MRICAFTDIHSNLKALKLLLSAIEKENPDETVFLGDVLAKGNEPIECIKLLMRSNVKCLAGNCDLYYTRGVDIDDAVLQYRDKFESLEYILSSEERTFMKTLPLEYTINENGKSLYFSHFLLKAQDEPYPFIPVKSLSDGTFEKEAQRFNYDFIVIGHSHKEFEMNNIVSLCSAGLDYPSYIVIDVNDIIKYRIVKPDEENV